MKLSMKSRYGLRALIDLAINSKTEQVALNSIAERKKISTLYNMEIRCLIVEKKKEKKKKSHKGFYFLIQPKRLPYYTICNKNICKKL